MTDLEPLARFGAWVLREIREAMARARCNEVMNRRTYGELREWEQCGFFSLDEAVDDTWADYLEEIDLFLTTLAAHGVDVARIAAGELKVLEREPTMMMVDAAGQTQGVKELDSAVLLAAVHGLSLTWDKKGLPPPVTQAWQAMWDAAPSHKIDKVKEVRK